jgi:hypothetical protein
LLQSAESKTLARREPLTAARPSPTPFTPGSPIANQRISNRKSGIRNGRNLLKTKNRGQV